MVRDEAYNLIDRLDNDVLTDVLNYALRINPSIFAAVVAQNMSNIIPFFTEDDKTDMQFLAKRFLSNSRKPIKSSNASSTEEQLAKIYGELEEMIDVQVYSHELRDDLIDASKAVRKARETAYRVLTRGQKDKYGMTIGSSVVGGSIKDELKKEIRKVLEENGYSGVQDGVEAAADYILMEDEYYSPSLSELPSVAEKWFKETKESFPETLIKASKTIKSSLEDRLIPYLEEFEEGYSNAMVDDPMDHYAGVDTTQVRLETFFDIFKNDYNLTDDDINKLENTVLDIWNETNNEINQDEWNEMYGKE